MSKSIPSEHCPCDYPERSTVSCEAGKRVALCRCWQSKKFPYCDGAHRAYNEEHGTALGPVIVEVAAED